MSNLYLYTDPIERLHQENYQFIKSMSRRFTRPDSVHNRAVERRAVDKVMDLASQLGYRANLTTKNAPFDLWIEGCKVEVKGSKWSEKGRGRYQAAIRNQGCDLLIFDCINGTDHLHFIPSPAIGCRRNIAVWSYAPEESTGQWRPFLEEQQFLHQAIEAANHIWQPPLF